MAGNIYRRAIREVPGKKGGKQFDEKGKRNRCWREQEKPDRIAMVKFKERVYCMKRTKKEEETPEIERERPS